MRAFRRRPLDDIAGIAAEVESKSIEQVQHYLNVFLTRFRELKERDFVLKKFQQKDFDQKNLETILNFEEYRDYAILLQNNHYYGREQYLALIENEHLRLKQQNNL